MADDADRASAQDERAMELLMTQLRASRAQTPTPTAALDCEQCGDEIPHARRVAVPHTRQCVRCAAARERLYLRGGL